VSEERRKLEKAIEIDLKLKRLAEYKDEYSRSLESFGKEGEAISESDFKAKMSSAGFKDMLRLQVDFNQAFVNANDNVNDNAEKNNVKNNKIAVCTCIFNNYDKLRTLPEIPADISDKVDFYCFTDDPSLNVNDEMRWIVDATPYHYLDTEVDIKGRISTSLSKEMGNHYNIVSKYYK
jgi:hypothetical protein